MAPSATARMRTPVTRGWQTLALIVVLGLLPIGQSVARSLNVDEPCATDVQRVDFAGVTFCIPKSDARYEFQVDSFVGLSFKPQAFIGERRVSPIGFYDAKGNLPPDGTYIYISVKQPMNGGQSGAQNQVRLVRALDDALRIRANDPTFTEKIGSRVFDFERRDPSTIVGFSAPKSLDEENREIWVRMDATRQVQHTMICDYSQPADPLFACVSRFVVGDSIGTIMLFGGAPERSFRISEQIREDVQSFMVGRSSP